MGKKSCQPFSKVWLSLNQSARNWYMVDSLFSRTYVPNFILISHTL